MWVIKTIVSFFGCIFDSVRHPSFKQNLVNARILILKQTRNKFTSPASEREYSFKQFVSKLYKVQTFKWARVKIIATTIKATKQVQL